MSSYNASAASTTVCNGTAR